MEPTTSKLEAHTGYGGGARVRIHRDRAYVSTAPIKTNVQHKYKFNTTLET